MEESIVKEDISFAYLAACCSSAGINYERHDHDQDGTDCSVNKLFTRNDGTKYQAELNIQMKCTSSASQYVVRENIISYRLKAKNYNDLCTPSTTPFILCLLVLPEEQNEWINWTLEELLIRGTMYWERFDGFDRTDNGSSVTVSISKKHLVNPDTLNWILQSIAEEEW